MKEQIKVMIIDDSALARQVLSEILVTDPNISIIGAAADPIFAERYMQKEWPDVILLDLEMPRMDGMTFLRNLMQSRPTPVVICSGLAGRSATVAMAALSQGAVEVISKPEIGVKNFFHENAQQLIQTVRAAALAKMKPGPKVSSTPLQVQPKLSADVILPAANPARTTGKRNGSAIVAIGASTGGTTALEYILLQLKPPVQPILIVQHMPEKFTLAFAQRLDQICGIAVKEAEDGDLVSPGRALIAPGGRHMMLKRGATGFQVHVSEGPLVNRHRPSVDVLFRSVARETGGAALGILLTGMGDDGAAGLLEMKQVGCRCVAQDEKTSVVFGMPKEAIKRGAAGKVLPLENMPDEIIKFSGETNG